MTDHTICPGQVSHHRGTSLRGIEPERSRGRLAEPASATWHWKNKKPARQQRALSLQPQIIAEETSAFPNRPLQACTPCAQRQADQKSLRHEARICSRVVMQFVEPDAERTESERQRERERATACPFLLSRCSRTVSRRKKEREEGRERESFRGPSPQHRDPHSKGRHLSVVFFYSVLHPTAKPLWIYLAPTTTAFRADTGHEPRRSTRAQGGEGPARSPNASPASKREREREREGNPSVAIKSFAQSFPLIQGYPNVWPFEHMKPQGSFVLKLEGFARLTFD